MRGRPRGVGPAPTSFTDRFQKYYYAHRSAIRRKNRGLYILRRDQHRCVRCGRKALKDGIFCTKHLEYSRTHSRREKKI